PGSDKVANKLSKKYWLVSEQPQPGLTEYDIDVYVNSKWIRKLRSDDSQSIVDLTPHLVSGKNTVLFAAKKLVTERPRTISRAHVFKVMVGEGASPEDQVKLNAVLVKFERTAADRTDESREFIFSAR